MQTINFRRPRNGQSHPGVTADMAGPGVTAAKGATVATANAAGTVRTWEFIEFVSHAWAKVRIPESGLESTVHCAELLAPDELQPTFIVHLMTLSDGRLSEKGAALRVLAGLPGISGEVVEVRKTGAFVGHPNLPFLWGWIPTKELCIAPELAGATLHKLDTGDDICFRVTQFRPRPQGSIGRFGQWQVNCVMVDPRAVSLEQREIAMQIGQDGWMRECANAI